MTTATHKMDGATLGIGDPDFIEVWRDLEYEPLITGKALELLCCHIYYIYFSYPYIVCLKATSADML